MKNITWLLLLVLFVFSIFCNDDLLSKFYQHGFKIKDVRMQLMRCNKKYFTICELKAYKYNRTTPAANVTFRFKIDVKDKIEAVTQVQKFLSNEYRHFPIRFQVNVNKAFKANVIGLQSLTTCGNITTLCFDKNITYYACNFVVDETRLPPLLPNGIFRNDIQMLYLNEEIALIYIFWEIYIPIDYPKK